jgi:hypothetical protein
MEKRTKEQAIESVKGSISSIFSKEDVIAIINSIQQENELDQDDLVSAILDELTNRRHDVIDLDSAEFELNGNEISLERVDLDENRLEEAITTGVNDYINRR